MRIRYEIRAELSLRKRKCCIEKLTFYEDIFFPDFINLELGRRVKNLTNHLFHLPSR